MKVKRFVIGMVVLFAFAACNSKAKVADPVATPSPALSSIDSLMWQRPDSALALLLPWFDTCRDVSRNVSEDTDEDISDDVSGNVSEDPDDDMSGDVSGNVSTATEYDLHYANLLLAELLYKNDYTQTNRAELLQAMCYFDSLMLTDLSLRKPNHRDASNRSTPTPQAIDFLAARAHYINGVGYYENDSVVQACAEYLKALEVMGDSFRKKEIVENSARFMALTYTRLAMLFSDMYLHEQAIYFAQLALSSNKKTDVPNWHIARMLCEIGIQYEIMQQLDSAECYYTSAAIVLNDTNNLLFRDIFTRQTFLAYRKGDIHGNTLSQLDYLIRHVNDETEYISRCLTIGEIFYYEKQLDSAWFYLNNVYNNTKSIAAKKQAAEWLLDICKIQERENEIFEYASFLALFANQEENQSEVKSQLTELYNEFRQAILSQQHKREVKKSTTISFAVMCVLMVGLLAYVFLYHHNKRRKQLLEKQIKEEQFSNDMRQRALSRRLKHSNQKLQETLKRIENLETEHNKAEYDISHDTFGERYEAFRQSPICLEIIERVNNLHDNIRNTLKTNADITEYKSFAMTLSQTSQLTKTVESFFPTLYTSLKAKYASLDRKEWLHCCLYLLQLDKMSICVLLQEPYYTCRRYTLKLEKAFDCRQGLAAFLMEQSKSC